MKTIRTLALLAAAITPAASAQAQEYALRRVSITPGGTAIGENTRLTVSIAQPVAGRAIGTNTAMTAGVFPPPAITPCAADVAPPFGELNVNDVIDFVNAFNAGLPLADVAPPGGDGVVNVNDIIDFVNAFNAGCP